MLSNRPAKFGGRRLCSSGDIMFLVAEEQDSTCSPKFACTIYLQSTWRESTRHIMLISPILVTRA